MAHENNISTYSSKLDLDMQLQNLEQEQNCQCSDQCTKKRRRTSIEAEKNGEGVDDNDLFDLVEVFESPLVKTTKIDLERQKMKSLHESLNKQNILLTSFLNRNVDTNDSIIVAIHQIIIDNYRISKCCSKKLYALQNNFIEGKKIILLMKELEEYFNYAQLKNLGEFQLEQLVQVSKYDFPKAVSRSIMLKMIENWS